MFECLVFVGGTVCGIRRWNLVGGNMSQAPALRFEKPTPFSVGPLCLVFVEQDVRTQLLTILVSYLPAAMSFTKTVTLTLSNSKSQIHSFL